MPVMYNTGDWFTLRPGVTYRKIELYNINWPSRIDIDAMDICAAPFGGPFALKSSKPSVLPFKGAKNPNIEVYNSAGQQISHITKIEGKNGNIVTMGWSDSEELICVQENGQVTICDMFDNFIHKFNMDKITSYAKVIDAKVFASNTGTGVAVMTSNFRILLVNNVKDVKDRHMPDMPNSITPKCFEIGTDDRNTFAIVASDKEVFKLYEGENISQQQKFVIDKPFNSIVKMSISYNHRYLAICTDTGIVWLGTTDMKKFCEFDTMRPSETPRQMEWCLDSENCSESDAIILSYPSLLLIISIHGDLNMYTYDPTIHLIPEMDGVRVLTNTCHEMIQKIPKSVYNIFAINSQEPASFLFEAHTKFLEKSHRSDEYLGLFKDKIDMAVEECIEAAGYEFDTETQKSLIRAAYFGKGLIAQYNPDDYIRMCRILRVLNALRHHKVGLPLTYRQFSKLKSSVILDRLVFREHYAIAIQIAKYLKLGESRILEHWAFHKISSKSNDEEVARKITEKFKNPTVQGVSFTSIARKAFEGGRHKLALTLLQLEPKAALQVPLLLDLKKYEEALKSAIKSGDTDLIYTVLFKLKGSEQYADFQTIIHKFPNAQKLYKKYCQVYNKPALAEVFNTVGDYVCEAEHALREGIERSNLDDYLPTAIKSFNNAKKPIEAELCSDLKKVSEQQKRLTEKYESTRGILFYDLTIQETLEALLRNYEIKLAEKFKHEYKIPDKRFWWARIQVLSEQNDWEELEKFSKSKKSPIGYEPFAEVCLNRKNVEQAKKYLPKCRESKKVKWYTRAGLLEEAANIAFEQRDLQSLYNIHMKASKGTNRELVAKLENFITQFSSKK